MVDIENRTKVSEEPSNKQMIMPLATSLITLASSNSGPARISKKTETNVQLALKEYTREAELLIVKKNGLELRDLRQRELLSESSSWVVVYNFSGYGTSSEYRYVELTYA